MQLPIVDISCQWNPTACGFGTGFFPEHDGFQGHPRQSGVGFFIPVAGEAYGAARPGRGALSLRPDARLVCGAVTDTYLHVFNSLGYVIHMDFRDFIF